MIELRFSFTNLLALATISAGGMYLDIVPFSLRLGLFREVKEVPLGTMNVKYTLYTLCFGPFFRISRHAMSKV